MRLRNCLLLSASLLLAACGGGGSGSGVASIPPSPPAPAPSPTPTPSAAPVKIFAAPAVGEYASVGASIAAPGGNLDTYSSPTSYGPVSTSDADQAHIRYTSAGVYEVQLPGSAWDQLVPYKGSVNPDPDTNNYFQPAGLPMNLGYVVTRNSRNDGYLYSELASWGSQAAGRFGYIGLGSPTPAGGVPTSGSASFNGVVSGSTDIMMADYLYGGYVPISTDGYVALNFDFGAGTLAGSMQLFLPIGGMNPIELGTFAFKDTVFSAGATTYSGRFDTSVAGQNFFTGRFTGPNAQETIGAWAMPFVFDTTGGMIPPDGKAHQAFGAWIAKRGN